MRIISILLLAALSLLVGCQPTYPGGLSQQEWEALPPEKRAELKLQQDTLDEQRRANASREEFQDKIVAANDPNQQNVPQPAIPDSPDMVNSWVILGRHDVDFRVDHDVIPVGAQAGAFSTLRFTVHGGDIDVYKVVVVLGNGEKFGFDVRGHYNDNSISGAMVIPKTPRYIDHVEVTYRSHAPRPFRTVSTLHAK